MPTNLIYSEFDTASPCFLCGKFRSESICILDKGYLNSACYVYKVFVQNLQEKITIFVKTNRVFLAQLSHCLKNMRHCCEKFDVIMAGWRKPYILYSSWRFHSMLLFGKYWYILWNMVFMLYYQRNKSTNTTPENLNYMVCSRKKNRTAYVCF